MIEKILNILKKILIKNLNKKLDKIIRNINSIRLYEEEHDDTFIGFNEFKNRLKEEISKIK